MTSENVNAQPDGVNVKFEHRCLGSQGKIQLAVTLGGERYSDKFDVTKCDARERAVKAITKKFIGLGADVVDRELDRIASEVAGEQFSDDESGGRTDDGEILIQIASSEDVELFRAGSRQDAEAYAGIQVDGHRETWSVKSRGFEFWLLHRFFELFQRAPSAQKLKDALRTIESKAIHSGTAARVHLRVAEHDGAIFVDLVDDNWNVVRITARGWDLIPSSACPVRFVRKRGMGALPIPLHGGSIEELRPFVNCPLDDVWHLYAGSLPQFFWPRGPYAVMVFVGEQGSAKSTTGKRTRALTDPSVAPVRRLPNDERDLMIAASNAFALFFDNLSTIPPKISDALCSIATGGGFGTRLLYSDDEEKLINVMRPIVLNGIEDVASRADLLDRSLILNLPPIPEDDRKEDAKMDADFEAACPRILGAIFDAVATALRRYPTVALKRKPRMIDFAKWCSAAEESYGWPAGTFITAYMRNRGEAVQIAIENSPVGATILRLMERCELWEGTAAELLKELVAIADDDTKSRRDWPKNPRGMSDALRRIAPALRALGVSFTGVRRPGGNRERIIELRRTKPTEPDAAAGTDNSATGQSRDDAPISDRPGKQGSDGVGNAERDGRDDRDGRLATSAQNDESADPRGAPQQSDTVARQEDLFVDNFPKRPSQPSRPSRNAAGDIETADSAGRSRDGQREHGTVDAPDEDRDRGDWEEV